METSTTAHSCPTSPSLCVAPVIRSAISPLSPPCYHTCTHTHTYMHVKFNEEQGKGKANNSGQLLFPESVLEYNYFCKMKGDPEMLPTHMHTHYSPIIMLYIHRCSWQMTMSYRDCAKDTALSVGHPLTHFTRNAKPHRCNVIATICYKKTIISYMHVRLGGKEHALHALPTLPTLILSRDP